METSLSFVLATMLELKELADELFYELEEELYEELEEEVR
jgi:hypothetical protein